jgi:hypothetical protein
LISNDMIYRLRPDNDLFRLEVYGEHTPDKPYWWKSLNSIDLYKAYKNAPETSELADIKWFFMSALLLYSAEGYNRSLVQRISARGSRNIRMKTVKGFEYLSNAIINASEQSRKKQPVSNKSNSESGNTMNIAEENELIHNSLIQIKTRLNLPTTNPVQDCYRITDAVLEVASDACKSFLNQTKTRGILTTIRFDRLKIELAKMLRLEYADDEEFQDKFDTLVARIEDYKTIDHLSAISLTTKNGHLLVSIVNVRGEMVTFEAWKLLRLIDDHSKQIHLGSLERRGYWEPEPLLEFNQSKIGDVYAVYVAEESILHTACERTKITDNDRTTKDPLGKASFIVDQDYLVCLYITIAQLRANKERFDEYRERAEAQVVTNVDHLFDPGLFEN